MIELLRTWIFGLTAASVLLALAETLVTQEGIGRVIRLAGGVLMILVLLQPVLRIDPEDLSLSMDAYRREVDELTQAYDRQQKEDLVAGIEAQLSSYIWDKAQELGLTCHVDVTVEVGEDAIPLPQGVTVVGPYSEELSGIIEKDLGIPVEKQNWQEAS